MIRFSWILVPAMIGAWSGSSANAQGSQTAEELIAQGVEQRRQGHSALALEYFERAHELAPSGRTHGQLGLAHQALGNWNEAYRHLSAALAAGGDWVAEHEGPLRDSLAYVQQQGGRNPSSGRRGWGFGIGGVGVASGFLAVIAYGLAVKNQNTFNSDSCLTLDASRGENCPDERASFHTFRRMSIASGAIGVALIATGVVLIVAGNSSERERAVVCNSGPGDVGFLCGVRF